ncbi:AraC family transcriptional regulator [Leifsonia sp. NPDC058292]|uniref:AraC family transcriptional regulator n=1 Tax=Leifsonia sp. NPDC058292 TaxID=3346428 RepID=UPI0036DC6802
MIERVWRSRGVDTATMTSVSRPHWDFVFWQGADGIHAGVQGPESRASQAPVPSNSEFLGIRLALGAFVPGFSMPQLVDRFVELPVERDWFTLAGDRIRKPRFTDAEQFVALLVRRGLLDSADVRDAAATDRTRQRRYLASVGLPQRTVQQIERANDAAVRLREGQAPAAVAQDTGYFDQPHMARSLRRFIGPSATELADANHPGSPLSLLYKTEPVRAQ